MFPSYRFAQHRHVKTMGVLLGTKVRGRAAYGELVTHMLVATDSSAQLGAMTTLGKRLCYTIRTLAGWLVCSWTYAVWGSPTCGCQPCRAVESLPCADDGAPPDLVNTGEHLDGWKTHITAGMDPYICKPESTAEKTDERRSLSEQQGDSPDRQGHRTLHWIAKNLPVRPQSRHDAGQNTQSK